MEVVRYVIVLVALLLCTWTDCREKKISVLVLGATAVMVCIFQFLGEAAWWSWMVTGGIFIMLFGSVSVITRGQLGMGDALLFGVLGLGLGFLEGGVVILLTFFVAFIVAAVVVITKRMGRMDTLPLCPCMLAGYIMFLCFQSF